MDQLFKCYENIHSTNLKEYVTPFGNINKDGHLVQYCRGVHSEHWRQISFQEFAGEARPEALILIEFLTVHKRLPNWIRPLR